MKIGVLTGGGDTSALNATLKGIALRSEELGFELVGFMRGWAGVLPGGEFMKLTPDLIDENHGGTLLQSSRTNLIKRDKTTHEVLENRIPEAVDNLKKLGIDALIPIGGDDTLTVGSAMSEEFRTTFVTKTIDNDVGVNAPKDGRVKYEEITNYFCPGFPSAAQRVMDYVRDIRTTCYSHNRVIFVEAMGREAGWLALAGAYGHADGIVVPEVPYDADRLAELVEKKHRENGHAVIVVSEGIKNRSGEFLVSSPEALDGFGHARAGGCSELIVADIGKRLPGISVRHQVLGYLQRCGAPITLDRDMAIGAGKLAVEAIAEDQINHVATIMRTEHGIMPKLLHLDDVLKRGDDGHVIRRSLDLRFYDRETFQITQAGIGYFRAMFGDLPQPRHRQTSHIKIERL